MFRQHLHRGESGLAVNAVISHLAGVQFHQVRLHLAGGEHPLLAVRTVVRVEALVHALVRVKSRVASELLAAHLAHELELE